MKKFLIILLAILVAGGTTAGIIVGVNANTPTSEVSMSINPDMTFVVNGNNKVVSVLYENEDAEQVFANVEFEGKKIDVATELVIKQCVITGKIDVDSESHEISVLVNGKTDKSSIKLQTKVEAIAKEVLAEVGVEATFDNDYAASVTASAEALGVSVRKYSLIVAVQVFRPEMSLDELKEMKEKELLKILEEERERVKDLTYTQFNSLMTTVASLKERVIDAAEVLEARLSESNSVLAETAKTALNAAITAFNALYDSTLESLKTVSAQAWDSLKTSLQTMVSTHEEKVTTKLNTLKEAGKLSEQQVNEWKEFINANK